MENYYAKWNFPTTIYFGVGRRHELLEHCGTLSMRKPLLLTDASLLKLPIIEAFLAHLDEQRLKYTLFTDIKPNPISKNIDDGLKALRDGGHDGVIALGGGSVLDAAKVIALMFKQSRPLWDFEDVGENYRRVDEAAIAPLIALPTTSGTGSEVGRASLIIDEDTKTKRFIFHPKIVPDIVIADPEFTVGLPPQLTAATGMDALAHNLEAFSAPGFHPMADGIALEGMLLIKEALPRAVKNGSDIEARAHLMAAASMGAVAFQKGLGAIHSLSHPVGAIYDAHHGLLNAIFMPYVLQYNQPCIDKKLERLAEYFQLPRPGFQGVLEWVIALCEAINIPLNLRSIGVDDQYAKQIASQALADPSTPTNPRPLTADDLESIFREALTGESLFAAASTQNKPSISD